LTRDRPKAKMKFLQSTVSLALLSAASAFAPSASTTKNVRLQMSDADIPEYVPAPATPETREKKDDLKKLANELNPIVNFFDPLNLAEAEFWGQSPEASIGFLRHAEIKHGRVAMAAFVGYCIQSNFVWPWANTLEGDAFPSSELGPEAQWDALPNTAKYQIFTVIAALELWDECGGGGATNHYMSGRQAGKYPSFKVFTDSVHPVLELYDPFGFNKKMSAEKKERRLVMEINNGRLAMIGIFGFLAADAVPGSVPLLKEIAIPYGGNRMSPFSYN